MAMELRSSRSRSRTPFQTKVDHESSFELINHSEEIVHTYSTRNRVYKSGHDEVSSIPVKQRSVKKIRQVTSDYSSEDGENEISSSKSEQNSRLTRGSCTAKSNGQIKSALQVYKEAGEYWNKYPKTDYTYSQHSKNRTEVAPGVVAMPNMSRRSLHRYDNSQESFTTRQYDDSMEYEETATRKRYIEPKSLFRENNNTYYSTSTTVRKISVWQRIYSRIITTLFVIYQANTSAVLWVGRSYYKFVSKILMLDTWLLQRTNQNRRWGPLIALFFLPLLLLAGWWMFSSMNYALQMAYNSIITPIAVTTSEIKAPIALDLPKPSGQQPTLQINEEAIVRRVLEDPNFGNIITRQQSVIESLKNEMSKVRTQLDDTLENLKIQNTQTKTHVSVELSKCCQKQYIQIENHVMKILGDLIGKSDQNVAAEDISKWLHSVFLAKSDLERRLTDLSENLHADLKVLVAGSAQAVMKDVSEKLSMKLQQRMSPANVNGDESLTDSQVYRIVRDALAVYDADKTGLVDYALESSGGQILSTRCTESYNSKTAVISVLGFPLWYPSNTPRIVITPGVTPGECWAFQGFPGFLVIQLTGNVRISAFSLEHIPKTLIPGGRRDSAPKGFTVYGLRSEKDNDPLQLGRYEYDVDGPSLQYFPVQTEGPPFNVVELVVDSNHGNIHYTCLYRFRVHGNLDDELT